MPHGPGPVRPGPSSRFRLGPAGVRQDGATSSIFARGMRRASVTGMTWSILARNPLTEQLSAAVATRLFAIVVLRLRVEGRLGAVVTQAMVNLMLALAALKGLRARAAPAGIVTGLTASDPGRNVRQLHVLAADGASSRHTGDRCVGWCGHLDRPDVSVAGSTSAGPAVAEWLIPALEAGEVECDDKRIKQPAAFVAQGKEPYPEMDLWVDDRLDPLAEPRRLRAVAGERFEHVWRFVAGRDQLGVLDRAAIEAAVAVSSARVAVDES